MTDSETNIHSGYYTIDFGVNFASKNFNNITVNDIIKTSYDRGVDKFVSISNNYAECIKNMILSKENEQLWFTLGIHPHNADRFRADNILFIKENYIKHGKCFGVGCGLDYNKMFSTKENQKNAFEKQVKLAKNCNAKLYLHCRDAYPDFIEILNKYNHHKGLIHCFTGNLDQALELTNKGYKLGITGILYDKRKNKDLVEVIKDQRINLSFLIVETDTPYLSIYPEKTSNPINTEKIVILIAKLKKLDVIFVGNELYNNAHQFLQR